MVLAIQIMLRPYNLHRFYCFVAILLHRVESRMSFRSLEVRLHKQECATLCRYCPTLSNTGKLRKASLLSGMSSTKGARIG